MYRVSKAFAFEAAHRLYQLPATHPCSRLHGHSYVVELHLSAATLSPEGFVLDYGHLDVFKEWLDGYVDHRYLNDLFADAPPDERPTTAENLAAWFYRVAAELLVERLRDGRVTLESVVVRETAKTTAEYRPPPAPLAGRGPIGATVTGRVIPEMSTWGNDSPGITFAGFLTGPVPRGVR